MSLRNAFLIFIVLLAPAVVIAAPTTNYFLNIAPTTANTYDNGTAALPWLHFYTDFASTTQLTVSGQISGCAQFDSTGFIKTTGVNCGSGSGTVTNIATTFPIQGGPITTTGTITFGGLSTTTPFNQGGIAWAVDQNHISTIATGTLTVSGPLSIDNPTRALIGGAAVISCPTCTTGGITALGSGYASTTGTTITFSTTTQSFNGLTMGQTITVPNGSDLLFTPAITGTLNNSGLTNSSVTINTTSPLSGGGALSLGGTLTLTCPTCSVAMFGYPFITATTYSTTTAATSTSIWTKGVFFASSTVATSTFDGGFSVGQNIRALGSFLATSTVTPGYAFDADGSTGIGYSTSPNPGQLIFTASGAEVGRFDGSTAAFLLGETAPLSGGPSGSKLEFANTASGSDVSGLLVVNKSNTTNSSITNYWCVASSGIPKPCASITVVRTNVGGAGNNDMFFSTYNGSRAEVMRLTAAGYVGIGTSSPQSKLDVESLGGIPLQVRFVGTGNLSSSSIDMMQGNASDTLSRIESFSGGGANNSGMFAIDTANAGIMGERLRITNTGNVGIGTTTPASKLDVNGQVRTGYQGGGANGLLVQFATNLPGSFSNLYTTSGIDDTLNLQSWDSKPLAINPSGNNVGIGTSTPDKKLAIYDGSVSNGFLNQMVSLDTAQNVLTTGSGGVIGFKGFNGSYFGAVGGYGVSGTVTGVGLWGGTAAPSGAPGLILTNSSNVGINSTAPASRLDVRGSVDKTTVAFNNVATFGSSDASVPFGIALGFVGGATTGARTGFIQSQEITSGNSGNLSLEPLNGNVGIATSTPSEKLDVLGNARLNSGASGTQSYLTFANGTTNEWFIADRNAADTPNNRMGIFNAGGSTEVMTLLQTGNVGIGKTNPSVALDVAGSVQVSAGSAYLYNGTNAYIASTTILNFFGGTAGNLTYTGTIGRNDGFGRTMNGITTGSQNSGLGDAALNALTTGTTNTAMGASSAQSITTGTSNVAIGYNALQIATSTASEVAIGTQALLNDIAGGPAGSAHANTAIGTNALLNNTYGYQNTATGFASMQNNTTGFFNSAYGYSSLVSNTTGAYNTVSGYQAMNTSTSTTGNTSIGFQSMFYAGDPAVNNVAIGYQALMGVTGVMYGGYNSAVGLQTLLNNTTGINNSGFGYNALVNNTTGNNNSALGIQTLNNNTTGNLNTGVGIQAGYANTTGSENVYLGYLAGYQDSAGGTGANTGSDNVVIGPNQNMLVNKSGSNQLNIGNLIFGTGIGTGSALSGGKIGIGTTSPQSRLTVNGDIGTDGANVTVTSCGSGATVTVGSTDTSGEITEGTLATGCTISFAATKTRAPFCVLDSQAGLAFSNSESVSAITVVNIGALSSSKIDFICVQNNQ